MVASFVCSKCKRNAGGARVKGLKWLRVLFSINVNGMLEGPELSDQQFCLQ